MVQREGTPSANPGSPQAMLVSLGGSPQPLVASLRHYRPQAIIFFASTESQGFVEEVLAALPADFRPKRQDVLITNDAEDLEANYRAVIENVPRMLVNWHLEPKDLLVDFTGGTKAMSAAVVLALAPRGAAFTYVGGGVGGRERGGVGVVVDGKEKVLRQPNPWNAIAAEQIALSMRLLRLGRYQDAADRLPGGGTGGSALLAAALRQALAGLAQWDRQMYAAAKESLEKALHDLRLLLASGAEAPALRFLRQVETAFPFLTSVWREWDRLCRFEAKFAPPGVFSDLTGMEIPRDLCAAARRRAELHNDPEDGVILLYAAVEKAAKARLRIRYGIDNSRCSAADLEASPGLAARLTQLGGSKLQLGLEDSIALLASHGDDFGLRVKEAGAFLEKLQAARNHCWREHGYGTVKPATFQSLFPGATQLLGFSETDLVEFPDGEGW